MMVTGHHRPLVFSEMSLFLLVTFLLSTASLLLRIFSKSHSSSMSDMIPIETSTFPYQARKLTVISPGITEQRMSGI